MGGAVFPPCFLTWPKYDGSNEDNEDLQNVPWRHCCIQCPQPCNKPLPTHASFSDSWTLMGSLGQSPCRESNLWGPDSLWGYYSFSCFLVCTSFVCVLEESVSPVLCKFCWFCGGLLAVSSKRAYAIPRSAGPRASVPAASHCWSVPPEEKLSHSSGSGLWVGHVFCALPRSEQLRQPGAWQVHCPSGPASQSPPVPAARFPRCTVRAPSQVCCMSPLESSSLSAALLVDVNHSGSQEDMVSSWEPAHSLVEDAAAPCLLVLTVAGLPFCLQVESDRLAVASSPLVFTQSFVLWVTRLPVRFEPFAGKFSFPQLWLGVYSVLFHFFFPPGYVALWDSKTPYLPACERVSYSVEISPPSRLHPRDRSPSLTLCLSFCLLYFVLPPFKENRLSFWVPGIICHCLEVVFCKLLSIQMIFWWICGGEGGLPVLFLCRLAQSRNETANWYIKPPNAVWSRSTGGLPQTSCWKRTICDSRNQTPVNQSAALTQLGKNHYTWNTMALGGKNTHHPHRE